MSGVFSAFFVNDTMCLVLTPLVLEVTLQLKRHPIPYLLAVAMASNVGSVATITGNPQNMMIGAFSHLSYRAFAAVLAPVAMVGLVMTFGMIAWVYRSEFFHTAPVDIPSPRVRVNRVLMWKSLAATAVMIVLFFMGWPVAKVAVVVGAALLVTRRVKPEKVYREIDWALLVLFAGLFVVIAGAEKALISQDVKSWIDRFHLDRVGVLTALTALLSNLVSNVPAVLMFKPFVSILPDANRAWLTLAMSSTLAGNLTLLGSIANLIVVERSRSNVRISFMEYLKVGVPLTILTLVMGALLVR